MWTRMVLNTQKTTRFCFLGGLMMILTLVFKLEIYLVLYEMWDRLGVVGMPSSQRSGARGRRLGGLGIIGYHPRNLKMFYAATQQGTSIFPGRWEVEERIIFYTKDVLHVIKFSSQCIVKCLSHLPGPKPVSFMLIFLHVFPEEFPLGNFRVSRRISCSSYFSLHTLSPVTI